MISYTSVLQLGISAAGADCTESRCMTLDRDDNTLIALTLEGDQNAFRELVERYQERSCRVAYQFVRDYEDARDLSQTAFVKAYHALDRFDRKKKFFTWFYRILANLCVDHIRKQKRNVSLEELGDFSSGQTPLEQLADEEVREQLYAALDRLPAKYRALIVMRDMDSMSCLDIAQVMKCSYTTVRWRLHRARNLLQKEWIKVQNLEKRHGVEP